MALVQSTLSEAILSRSEQNVVRSIYHASQLNDALLMLQKVVETRKASLVENAIKADPSIQADLESELKMTQYLMHQIKTALINTKIPQSTQPKANPSGQSGVS